MKLAAIGVALALAACVTTQSTKSVDVTRADAAIRAGLAKVDAHDELGAIEDFTRAIELDPSKAMAWCWRGHCLNLNGYYEEALHDYDRAIELDPTDAWSHYARAMAQHNLKHYEVAMRGYTDAIERDARYWKAWSWRGFTHGCLGEYVLAAQDMLHALEIAPDDPKTLFDLAKVRQAQNDLDACERALTRVAELEPWSADVRAQCGFLAAVRGSTSRSIAEFEAAAAIHAPEETYARIWIWMQRADRESADRELRAWFDDSNIVDIWQLQLAAFLLGEGNDELMIARAEAETSGRVANGDPPDFFVCEALFYAALRHEFRGERTEARALYERASSLQAPESWEWQMARVRARSIPR